MSNLINPNPRKQLGFTSQHSDTNPMTVFRRAIFDPAALTLRHAAVPMLSFVARRRVTSFRGRSSGFALSLSEIDKRVTAS